MDTYTNSSKKEQYIFNTIKLGKKMEYMKSIDTTQKKIHERAAQGEPEGYLVLSDKLTNARGRFNRDFFTTTGGLYFSILLRPKISPNQSSLVSLAAGASVSLGIEDQTSLITELKWPNDCLINGRKVCGVIAESIISKEKIEYIAIGFGINVNFPRSMLPKSIHKKATTLFEECNCTFFLPKLLNQILVHLEELYDNIQAGKKQEILDVWRKRNILKNREVEIEENNGTVLKIRVIDIDPEGNLVAKSKHGIQHFTTGEIIKIY